MTQQVKQPDQIFPGEKDRLEHIREVWKVALDTQMHFNDLLIKMRTTVISIILAVFGASAIVVKDVKHPIIVLGHHNIHISSIILSVGIIFLICQFIIDRCYYFKLLLGAVDFTDDIDQYYKGKDSQLEVFGLTCKITSRISKESAAFILCVYYIIPIIVAGIVIWLIQTNLEGVGAIAL